MMPSAGAKKKLSGLDGVRACATANGWREGAEDVVGEQVECVGQVHVSSSVSIPERAPATPVTCRKWARWGALLERNGLTTSRHLERRTSHFGRALSGAIDSRITVVDTRAVIEWCSHVEGPFRGELRN